MNSTIGNFMISQISSATNDDIRKSNRAFSNALDVINSRPVIITQPSNINNLYSGLNNDKNIQKTVTKYYYYKIIDKWIYKDLFPILAFIDSQSNKIQLIKDIKDYDIEKLNKDSDDIIEKKVDYLENILLTKDMVKYVLQKICSKNNINWYDLNKYERKIKKIFYKYLRDKLKYAINKYGHKNTKIHNSDTPNSKSDSSNSPNYNSSNSSNSSNSNSSNSNSSNSNSSNSD